MDAAWILYTRAATILRASKASIQFLRSPDWGMGRYQRSVSGRVVTCCESFLERQDVKGFCIRI
jgi:hypothetical protein